MLWWWFPDQPRVPPPLSHRREGHRWRLVVAERYDAAAMAAGSGSGSPMRRSNSPATNTALADAPLSLGGAITLAAVVGRRHLLQQLPLRQLSVDGGTRRKRSGKDACALLLENYGLNASRPPRPSLPPARPPAPTEPPARPPQDPVSTSSRQP